MTEIFDAAERFTLSDDLFGKVPGEETSAWTRFVSVAKSAIASDPHAAFAFKEALDVLYLRIANTIDVYGDRDERLRKLGVVEQFVANNCHGFGLLVYEFAAARTNRGLPGGPAQPGAGAQQATAN